MYKNKKLAAFLASLMAMSLVACGGGGGDDDDDTDIGGDDEEDASGAGIWSGTFRVDGLGAGQPMGGLVTEEGDFALVTIGTVSRLHFGTGSTDGKSFSATAKSYAAGASVNSSFLGTINDGVSITGSYSLTGESALFNLAFSNTYLRSASYAILTGTYMVTVGASGSNPETTLTVDIAANGSFTYTNSTTGCAIGGTFTVPHANRNYYRWSGTAAGCAAGDGAMSGVAYLADVPAGQNKQLVMMGRHATSPSAIFVAVARP